MGIESLSTLEVIVCLVFFLISPMVFLTAYRLEMIQRQNRDIIAHLEGIRHNTSISADFHFGQ